MILKQQGKILVLRTTKVWSVDYFDLIGFMAL